MTVKCLVPRLGRTKPVVRSYDDFGLDSFDRQFNRLFNEFFRGIAPAEQATDFTPRLNVSESDKELKVEAELPGIDEKDVKVELDEDTLVLSGEKKAEEEKKDGEWYRVERNYGSFHRVIPLPSEVDGEKAKASYKNGVLTITLPKLPEEKATKKTISINAS